MRESTKVRQVRQIPGHDCTLPLQDDILQMHINSGLFVEYRRKFRRLLMVDPTHPYSLKLFKSTAQLRIEEYRHITRYYYMVHPFSKLVSYIMYFMNIVYFLHLIIMPLEMIYVYPNELLLVIRIFIDIPVWMTIAMSFFIGYWHTESNTVRLDRKDVVKRYLLGHFLPDLISTLPYSLLIWYTNNIQLGPLKLFFILKLLRIKFFFLHYKKTIKSTRAGWLWDYIKMATILYFVFWWTLAVLIRSQSLIVGLRRSKYIRAQVSNWTFQLIRSLMLVCDLGFKSNNVLTDLLSGAAAIIGVLLFFTMFVFVYQLYQKQFLIQTNYNKTMNELCQYMEKKEIPEHLQNKIFRYLDIRFRHNIFKFNQIYEALSKILRQEINLHQHLDNLRRVEFFQNVPVHVLLALIERLRLEIVFQGENIITAGVHGTAMYFIESGNVAVYSRKNVELAHLEQGGHFGELALIVNEPRTVTITAIADCRIFKLSRRDFNEAIEMYPNMKKIIKESALMKLQLLKERFLNRKE